MDAPYRTALDTEADVAHAFVEGESRTLCDLPIAAYELETSNAGVARTVSVCSDCRGAYGPA